MGEGVRGRGLGQRDLGEWGEKEMKEMFLGRGRPCRMNGRPVVFFQPRVWHARAVKKIVKIIVRTKVGTSCARLTKKMETECEMLPIVIGS
jgi:hypothetical protein